MLFVDGMNGVINHGETLEWLYTLTGSQSRLLVKTSLKLLIVFVEYKESNSPPLIRAVNAVDARRGTRPWSYVMDILHERTACDCELLVFAMTLVNKTLAALPDQDSFYDVTDCLESLEMEDLLLCACPPPPCNQSVWVTSSLYLCFYCHLMDVCVCVCVCVFCKRASCACRLAGDGQIG
uniref:FHOD1/3-like FH3 domain-containing protein n=1 Tax=Hippocampus comes TaxID=109280 RepID=A0A3Q2XXQ0_HIPCM